MPIVKTFEYREDPEFGSLGWVPKGAPRAFNSGDGVLVAHDILEHRPNTSASWEDELMALGAMIFVRGEQGYFSRQYVSGWDRNMSVDLARCFEFLNWQDKKLKPLRTVTIDGIDDDIDSAIQMARKEADCKSTAYDRKAMKSWLRFGYRHAKRRYNNNGGRACNLFTQIAEESNRFAEYAQEGLDELKVSVSVKNWTAKIELKSINYEY